MEVGRGVEVEIKGGKEANEGWWRDVGEGEDGGDGGDEGNGDADPFNITWRCE